MPTYLLAATYLSASLILAGARAPRLGKNSGRCRQILETLSGFHEAPLLDLCFQSMFSAGACAAAKDALGGREMAPSLVAPVCSALLANPTADTTAHIEAFGTALVESAAALRQRSSQGATNSAALDSVLKRKQVISEPRGADYLVKSAVDHHGPNVKEWQADSSFPPVQSVDQTIQKPPDADGHFWNTPRDGWDKNKKPPASLVESVAALRDRSSQGASNSAALDSVLKRKQVISEPRGADYLVKSAIDHHGPNVKEWQADSSFPPVQSVDQTIQKPPDADGHFWNTPRDGWSKNKKPPASLVESVTALRHRSSHDASNSVSLDSVLKRKQVISEPRGADYLVKSAVDHHGPNVKEWQADSSFPPVQSVDQTIQKPPDADGHFWNTPRDGWSKNKKPPAALLESDASSMGLPRTGYLLKSAVRHDMTLG